MKKYIMVLGVILFILFPVSCLFAYIDPGSGFVFLQNTSWLWGIIIGFLGVFLFLFKQFSRFFKKVLNWVIIFLIILVISGMIAGVIMKKNNINKKVVILGIDAMDPKITEQLMQEGKLPNFSLLKERGSYSHLATTLPAESNVAWASFATGLNPGGHGIFDFIMRDPKTYLPYLSLSEISNYRGTSRVKLYRKGKPFWVILSDNKIPAYIFFCPNTFPPDHIRGKMLSGMGVPDITGTMGRFSFYTTKPLSVEDRDSRGRVVPVIYKDGVIETALFGPKTGSTGKITESEIALKITRLMDKEAFLDLQGKKFSLKAGEWSDWQKVYFKIGLFRKAFGIVRFYLKSVSPDFELYASPVNFDPRRPLFAISYPKNYSAKLAKKIGLYYTQGMPHDTWALSEGRLDEKAFLELTDEILKENEVILKYELNKFKTGVFFYYFETLDVVQHMFWRYIDPKSPLYEANSVYKDTIFQYYERIDRILGEVLKRIDKDTALIILSDHGFGPFRRSVHLNRWLLDNGYLVLEDGAKTGNEFLEDVDWAKTKAYALGFGGIYLNRLGREGRGIVVDSEIAGLKKEIQDKLSLWQDISTGENVIKQVYDGDEAFNGPYRKGAPDLFVGFDSGYRASWQTALGGTPDTLIDDNKKKWSGDHLVAPGLVPGVIFSNQKKSPVNLSIVGLNSLILKLNEKD